MMQIPCIHCGLRDESEFSCAGAAHLARPPLDQSDKIWGEYLFFRDNPKGLHAERWRHAVGCGRFFNCLRDTVSDKIVTTYKAGEPRPSSA